MREDKWRVAEMMTWFCINGYHGDGTLRRFTKDGRPLMGTGYCTGHVASGMAFEELYDECGCACHEVKSRFDPDNIPPVRFGAS